MNNWRTTQLGDIATLITSGSRGWASYYSENGAKFIRMTNLPRVGINLRMNDMKYVQLPAGNSEGSRTRLQEGDVLVSITAELGKIGYVSAGIGEAYINQHVALVRLDTNKVAPKLIAYMLSTTKVRNALNRRNDSGAKAGLNLPTLHKFPLSIPEINEQRRIVSILETWDEYIKQLDKKVELRVNLKAALTRQLLTGSMRLAGYTDQWEAHKLGDIVTIEKGKALSSNGLLTGNIPVIAGGKTSPYKHNSYTHENVVTVSASGAYAGYVSYHPYKIWASDCSVIEAKDVSAITEYIYYYLCLNQKRIYSLQSGGAQPHIYPADLKRLVIDLPSPEEQQSIVNTLNTISAEIDRLKEKKSSVETQKIYLVNGLSSGRLSSSAVYVTPIKEPSHA